MPIYAFACEDCGEFEVMRKAVDAGQPAACPGCEATARRVFTPPGLARLVKPLRVALDREEKSAHQPDVVGVKTGRPRPHKHAPAPPWVLSH
jgi:putative FmdB family regulatory protein